MEICRISAYESCIPLPTNTHHFFEISLVFVFQVWYDKIPSIGPQCSTGLKKTKGLCVCTQETQDNSKYFPRLDTCTLMISKMQTTIIKWSG